MNYYTNTHEELFLIEGEITESEDMSKIKVLNLMAELIPSSSTVNKVGMAVGVLTGNVGVVAGSAMAGSYSGELVDILTCRIGGRAVTGEFSGARLLCDGDQVKAVVAQRGEILYVHAIQRPADELLWLPLGSDRGRSAVVSGYLKLGSVFYFVVWLVFTATAAFSDILNAKYYPYYLLGMLGILLLLSFVFLWTYHDLKPLAIRAEQIFTVLGFPDVKKLDMQPGAYKWFHDITDTAIARFYESVFYYQLVLDSHRTGIKLRSDEELPDHLEVSALVMHNRYMQLKAKYAARYRERHPELFPPEDDPATKKPTGRDKPEGGYKKYTPRKPKAKPPHK